MDHGAKMEENEHGMTPLKVRSLFQNFDPQSLTLPNIQAAAERCQAVMVDYLIERPEVNRWRFQQPFITVTKMGKNVKNIAKM